MVDEVKTSFPGLEIEECVGEICAEIFELTFKIFRMLVVSVAEVKCCFLKPAKVWLVGEAEVESVLRSVERGVAEKVVRVPLEYER